MRDSLQDMCARARVHVGACEGVFARVRARAGVRSAHTSACACLCVHVPVLARRGKAGQGAVGPLGEEHAGIWQSGVRGGSALKSVPGCS
eukprot:9128496-Alexandrium_andersonii.AAC.1